MHVAQTSGKAHTVSEAWLAESSSPTLENVPHSFRLI